MLGSHQNGATVTGQTNAALLSSSQEDVERREGFCRTWQAFLLLPIQEVRRGTEAALSSRWQTRPAPVTRLPDVLQGEPRLPGV